MRRITGAARVTMFGLVIGLGLLVEPAAAACSADSVQSGTVCMDKYEASVWYVPSTQRGLILNIQRGTATLNNLTNGGAIQLGLTAGDLAANGCPVTGNGCLDVYAVSIRGVMPAAFITWFQAVAAARNSLKRLPTNQEWQAAALGTPDGAPCNVSGSVVPTGSASDCVSDVGAVDMVANLWEWVADWVPRSTTCGTWGAFSGDLQCLAGAAETGPPGALIRGGFWNNNSGVFAVAALFDPSFPDDGISFRCVR